MVEIPRIHLLMLLTHLLMVMYTISTKPNHLDQPTYHGLGTLELICIRLQYLAVQGFQMEIR